RGRCVITMKVPYKTGRSLLIAAAVMSGCAGGNAGMNRNVDADQQGMMNQQGMGNQQGTVNQRGPLNPQGALNQQGALNRQGAANGHDGMNGHGGMNNGDNHSQDRIDIADRAAEQVAALDGVRQANVLVTRNNAYVAAFLDDGQNELSREV